MGDKSHKYLTEKLKLASKMGSITALGGVILTGMAVSTNVVAEQTFAIEEVVVTARKRSETMLDVPISISVVSERNIEQLGAQDFTDLLGSVPGITAYQNGPGRTRLSIRGIANGGGNDNDTQNQETVGIYLDEIPISLGAMNPELGLFDLERVEVLRGPQGTLYGAGSMTGTIRLVSKKPNLSEVEGKVELDASSISHGSENYASKALINIPIIEDMLAIRISGYNLNNGGYIDNVLTGENDINDGSSRGLKFSSLWQATDDITAEFSYISHHYKDGGRPEDLERAPNLSRDYPSFDGYDDELDIYNFTFTYAMENMDLVASTSYFDRKVINPRSLDDLFAIALPPGIVPHELIDTTDIDVYAQEIRLSSNTDNALQWIVGVYFDKKDTFYLNTFPVPGADAILGIDSNDLGAPTDTLFFGFDDLTVKTYAVFGEAYYTLGKWTLTGGLRYFNWQQDIEFYQSGLFNGGVNSDARPQGKEDGINPKVNLSYELNDDVLIYGQAARGFRYGGINGAIPRAVCENELQEVERSGGDTRFFDADKAWTYELGSKGKLFDGRVSYTATYFYVQWEDIQTSRSFECGFGFRENVGEANSQGVEIEVRAHISENLTASFGGSYIDSTLDEDVPNLNASKGDMAPFVAKNTFNATLEYSRSLTSNIEGFVWLNYQYTGSRQTEYSRDAANFKKMDSYDLTSLRIGASWDSYEVSLYANNLFDDQGVVRALGRPPFDPDSAIRVQPRTIGVNLRAVF